MVFDLDDARLRRFQELFIEPEWLQPPHPVGYDRKLSANPFVAFEQIPPRSRYQFLLDNAHYIIMTFIHGPVCKGQIALNVINDQFWVMFLDPDHDLSVTNPGFLKTARRQAAACPSKQGSDQRHRFGPERRAPEGGGRLLPRPAGFLRVAQLRRARL